MDDMTTGESGTVAERIAAPLRSAERLPADFEERLLTRIRAERAQAALPKVVPRSWWTAPRTITRAPIMSFALAAGFAAIVAMTTLVATQSGPLASTLAATPDTVHVIRFVYHDTSASHIAVVGDFNEWGASEIPLRANGDGVWTATVALPAGSHEYAFVVNRDRWVADPAALSTRDEFGTPTSRVKLGPVDYVATE
jgi:hypothetical protein